VKPALSAFAEAPSPKAPEPRGYGGQAEWRGTETPPYSERERAAGMRPAYGKADIPALQPPNANGPFPAKIVTMKSM